MISFFTGSGGSGIIRGKQIAERIGARLNPVSGYENDICIYVKRAPPENYPKNTYVDVVEDSEGLRWAYKHQSVGVIASSLTIYEYLKPVFKKIVFIPQHNCNFNHEIRPERDIRTAGIVGNEAAFQYPLDKLELKLNEAGFGLKTLIQKRFSDRQEIVDFYKSIDIQLVWRPGSDDIIRNPLKLINACSFGIPTISYPEKDFFAEFHGLYIPVKSIDQMVEECIKLRNSQTYYDKYSIGGLLTNSKYHISAICNLYEQL